MPPPAPHVWSRSLDAPLDHLEVSQGAVLAVDQRGVVALHGPPGATLWTLEAPDPLVAVRCCAAGACNLLLTRRELLALDGAGAVRWRRAVQRGTGLLSDDAGRRIAVRHARGLDWFDRAGAPLAHWPLPTGVHHLALAPHHLYLCGERGRVSRLDHRGEPDRTIDLDRRILGMEFVPGGEEGGLLWLAAGSGAVRLAPDLEGARWIDVVLARERAVVEGVGRGPGGGTALLALRSRWCCVDRSGALLWSRRGAGLRLVASAAGVVASQGLQLRMGPPGPAAQPDVLETAPVAQGRSLVRSPAPGSGAFLALGAGPGGASLARGGRLWWRAPSGAWVARGRAKSVSLSPRGDGALRQGASGDELLQLETGGVHLLPVSLSCSAWTRGGHLMGAAGGPRVLRFDRQGRRRGSLLFRHRVTAVGLTHRALVVLLESGRVSLHRPDGTEIGRFEVDLQAGWQPWHIAQSAEQALVWHPAGWVQAPGERARRSGPLRSVVPWRGGWLLLGSGGEAAHLDAALSPLQAWRPAQGVVGAWGSCLLAGRDGAAERVVEADGRTRCLLPAASSLWTRGDEPLLVCGEELCSLSPERRAPQDDAAFLEFGP